MISMVEGSYPAQTELTNQRTVGEFVREVERTGVGRDAARKCALDREYDEDAIERALDEVFASGRVWCEDCGYDNTFDEASYQPTDDLETSAKKRAAGHVSRNDCDYEQVHWTTKDDE